VWIIQLMKLKQQKLWFSKVLGLQVCRSFILPMRALFLPAWMCYMGWCTDFIFLAILCNGDCWAHGNWGQWIAFEFSRSLCKFQLHPFILRFPSHQRG
jgi:hypothetical protein